MLRIAPVLTLALFFQAADPTLPPPNAHAKIEVIGHGNQVYRCTAQGNAFQWVLDGPDATLFDIATHQPVGTHTPGPTWTWNDHSAIAGKLLQKRPSPDPAAIPWLLLEAHSTGDPGVLSTIKFVRRSNTEAGSAPANGCDAQHQDNLLRVPYQATYTFYTAD